MRRRTRLMLVVGVAALALAAPILMRGAMRYRALRVVGRALDSPEKLRRANMTARKVVLDAPAQVNAIDIGYAVFDAGATGPVSIEAAGSGGASVVIKNDRVRISFLPPFARQGRTASVRSPGAATRGTGGRTFADMAQRALADPIGADQEIEETRPLSLARVLWMESDEFAVYSFNLCEKAAHRRGHNEVIFFTAAQARGIARVGDDARDRLRASVSLSSLDGRRNVGFHIALTAPAAQDIGVLLARMLGSFRFTVDAIEDQEQIARLISERGIRRQENGRRAAPASGPSPAK